MAGMGCKRYIWTKELDNELLEAITNGKSPIQLEVTMKMSYKTIRRRIKEMGFDGLRDARRVMTS
jgi:hypothetical protein